MSEPSVTLPARTVLQLLSELRAISQACACGKTDRVGPLIAARSEALTRALTAQLSDEQITEAIVAARIAAACPARTESG